jgi:hypothetical protein
MRRRTNMKKPTCNQAIKHLMHCNVLWTASHRCLKKCGKRFGTWKIIVFNKQKRIINNPHRIISSRNYEYFV